MGGGVGLFLTKKKSDPQFDETNIAVKQMIKVMKKLEKKDSDKTIPPCL